MVEGYQKSTKNKSVPFILLKCVSPAQLKPAMTINGALFRKPGKAPKRGKTDEYYEIRTVEPVEPGAT